MNALTSFIRHPGEVFRLKDGLRSQSELLPKKERGDPKAVARAILAIVQEDDGRWNQGDWGHFITPDRYNGLYTESREIYKDMPSEGEACETACCVAGWATLMTLPNSRLVYKRQTDSNGNAITGYFTQFEAKGEEVLPQSVGREALDLDEADAMWLFDETREQAEVVQALENIAGNRWNKGRETLGAMVRMDLLSIGWEPSDYDY